MAAPTVQSVTLTPDDGGSSTFSADLPATVNSGDLLIVLVGNESSARDYDNLGGDWSLLWEDDTNNAQGHVEAKIADGTEGGGTVDFTLSGAGGTFSAGAVARITGHDSDPIANIISVGSSVGAVSGDSPDPPSVTAAWGSDDNLFFAHGASGDDGATVSAYPTNYDDDQFYQQGNGAVTNSSPTVWGAFRALTADSDDPGAFTLSQSENLALNTIVIRPGAGGHTSTAAVVLGAPVIAAAGGQEIPGAAALDLAAGVIAASGNAGSNPAGTGALELPAASIAAAGAQEIPGTAALALPAASIAAAGAQEIPGTAALELLAAQIAAAGSYGNDAAGTAALALPAAAIAASGEHPHTGSAAMTLPAMQIAGTAAQEMAAAAALEMLAGVIAASGTYGSDLSGSAAIALPAASIAAAGISQLAAAGTAALVLPVVQIAAVAEGTIVRDPSLVFPLRVTITPLIRRVTLAAQPDIVNPEMLDLLAELGATGFIMDRVSALAINGFAWQDVGQETPADAVDDSIAYLLSRDPVEHYASAGGGAAWGDGYLIFGGANYLVSNLQQSPQMTLAVTAQIGGTTQFAGGVVASGDNSFIGLNPAGLVGAGVGSDSASVINSGGSDRSGQTFSAIVTFDGTTVTLWEDDGDTPVYQAAQSGSVDTDHPLFIGSRNNGSLVQSGNMTGNIYRAFFANGALAAGRASKLMTALQAGL